MKKFIIYIILSIYLLYPIYLNSKDENWQKIYSSAYFDNCSYKFLEKLCDSYGGRLMGSPNNTKAIDFTIKELENLGIKAKKENFIAPAWRRGNDFVKLIFPFERNLRAYSLGYVNKTDEITTEIEFCHNGTEEDFKISNVKGKIAIVNSDNPNKIELPLRYEAINNAANAGAKAIVFINDKEGGLILCGTSNFQGKPSKIPAYSIAQEDGKILLRILQNNISPKITIRTESECFDTETSNIVVTFNGKSNKKIVVGAHFDSWDLGQGAIDNGQGTAVLFELARLINNFYPNNYYTIELVWFNGEEYGLWGSKKYVESHKNDSIIYMINMDMIGSPNGFNIMGRNEFTDFFADISKNLNGFDMKNGVTSTPWTNSDHMYFMFEGIPTLTFAGHLEKNMYWHYHDFGDTFDKVDKKILSDAAAIVGIVIYELSNNKNLKFALQSKNDIKDMLIKFGLDKRLKKQGEWNFGD